MLDVASVTRIPALIRLSISISTIEIVRALANTHPRRGCTHGISYCRRYFRSWNKINDWLSVIRRTEGHRAIIHVGYFCFSIEPTWRIHWNSCKFHPPSWITKTEQRGHRKWHPFETLGKCSRYNLCRLKVRAQNNLWRHVY